MTTTSSTFAAVPLFRRKPAPLYPFATGRDLAIFGLQLSLVIGALLLAGQWLGYTSYLLPIVTGTTAGMAVTFQRYRPVHGVMPAQGRSALLVQLDESGFIPAAGSGDVELFVHKSPRWRNWDANRATLRRRPDGDFDATIPQHVFHRVEGRSLAL